MAGNDPFDIPFESLALEPLDKAPAAPVATKSAPTTKAQFTVDTRSGRDRRLMADRRVEFRMTRDRRSGKDRRPRKTWEPGHNI